MYKPIRMLPASKTIEPRRETITTQPQPHIPNIQKAIHTRWQPQQPSGTNQAIRFQPPGPSYKSVTSRTPPQANQSTAVTGSIPASTQLSSLKVTLDSLR